MGFVYEIDFSSREAIYLQLKNQIILGIATSQLQGGEMLPSVRKMADDIGINMHTVNKAYGLLQDEGFVTIGRKGTFVAVDQDRERALTELEMVLRLALARCSCRSLTRDDVHEMIDDIFDEYE